jgi:hypothetical protein
MRDVRAETRLWALPLAMVMNFERAGKRIDLQLWQSLNNFRNAEDSSIVESSP